MVYSSNTSEMDTDCAVHSAMEWGCPFLLNGQHFAQHPGPQFTQEKEEEENFDNDVSLKLWEDPTREELEDQDEAKAYK